MTDFWQLFLIIGGVLIFTVSVLDSGVRFIRHLSNGKKNADVFFDNRVRGLIIQHYNETCIRESSARELELKVLREFIANELKPIKDDISEIRVLNGKLHHAQMTSLQIKLSELYYSKFDKKGILTKPEQANWDKWFSDYHALGGNSDIKRMDDLIQKARIQLALEKSKGSRSQNKNKEEVKDNEN